MTEKQRTHLEEGFKAALYGPDKISNFNNFIIAAHDRIGELVRQIGESIDGYIDLEHPLVAAALKLVYDAHYATLDETEKSLCDDFSETLEVEMSCKKKRVEYDEI